MIGSRFVAFVPVALLALTALLLFGAAPQKEPERRGTEVMPPETWAQSNFSEPGDAHRKLEPLVGTFDARVKSWVAPEGEAVLSTAVCEGRFILGGRFVQEVCGGTETGQRFQAIALTGYDNHMRQYIAVGANTRGTSLVPCQGSFDAEGKVLTMTCEFVDPATGRKKTSRGVTRIRDAATRTYESFETGPDGREQKVLEITYTRR